MAALKIAIAGGHGKIALLLARMLADAGHTPIGIIRTVDQTADLAAAGAESLVLDLEQTDAAALAAQLDGIDAVVFAAGAGPGSTAERKLTVDRDGAVLLADAALMAGIRRYVMISAMSADTFDPESDEVFQIYLRAKSEADAAVRSRDLDWTIVRPGALTDESGAGVVAVDRELARGSIPRADVAAVVAMLLETGSAIGEQFELTSGTIPIAQIF